MAASAPCLASPSGSSPARSWLLRSAAGLILGLAVSSACQPREAEDFNAELSRLICEINAKCEDIDLRASFGSVEFASETCRPDVEDHFGTCGDACEYERRAARKCLRRLERVAEDCDPALSLGPCRRAYGQCETPELDDACTLHTCRVRPRSPVSDGWALGLLGLLGLAARRRRRARA